MPYTPTTWTNGSGAPLNATNLNHMETQYAAAVADSQTAYDAGLAEKVQDIVAGFLTQGTNVTIAYNDATNTLTISASGGGGGAVASVNTQTGVVVLNQDNIADGTTAKQYTATEKTKLSGVATGATANQSDATTNAAIAAKYTKPGSGITASDLASAVVTSLGKADTALQSAPVTSVAGRTGIITLTADDVPDGTTNKAYTATEKTKLAGVATGATANQTDATTNAAIALKAPVASPAFTGTPTGITAAHVGLGSVNNTSDASKPVSTAQAAADAAVQAAAVQRSNHTGTQTADTITDGTTNKAYTATEKTKLAGIATGATANQSDATTNAAIAAKVGSDGTILQAIKITQAAYDALTPKVATTLYIISG